uniref:Rad50/SbcC-type AAA domain-containing protein n=1 Tax=candidate division CPR3 bacterium TaxID=2268181 RepID=A0A7V3J9P5_UNCC3
MVYLDKFYMEGAFSYGKCEIDFSPGLVLLDGRNYDVGEVTSNMSGKTSVFDGIVTCLFEQNSKGMVKDNIINVLSKDKKASLCLDMVVGGKKVRVEYIRGKENSWTYYENGEAVKKSLRDMGGFIIERLGLDYNMFMVSSYIEQGRLAKFLELNDADRKRLIASYFGLNGFDALREKVKRKRQLVSSDLDSIRGSLQEIENSLSMKVEREVSEIERELSKYKGAPVSREEFEKNLSAFKKMCKLSLEYRKVKTEEDKLRESLRSYEDALSLKRKVLEFLGDNVCYVCGSKIDKIKIEKKILDERADLEEKVNKIRKLLREIEDRFSELRRWSKSSQLNWLRDAYKRIGDEGEYRKLLEELGRARMYREVSEGLLDRKKKLEGEEKTLSEVKELLDFWFDGFGPKGLPAMVMNNLVDGLNTVLSRYSELFGWKITCVVDDDKLDLYTDDGKKSLKGGYSGSEMSLVSLIVAFAMRDWLNMSGKGTNVLFLDEVFAPFDSTMRLKLFDFLSSFSKDRCVVVVSHNEDLKNKLGWDRVWRVEKRNGISNLFMEE